MVDESIGHRDMVKYLLGGCMIDLGGCECDGAEHTWSMMLRVVYRVLLRPSRSVLPG
jgi:hypothetical protein